ncbi:hypothetical protein AKJ60_00280 [candidate division MSBL1 archaeon SCGC-AAA385M11]|nr:hypothetical protein AKJ60_00280 [candidate division MSBL1 archaeon SCGC-AAA385M11]
MSIVAFEPFRAYDRKGMEKQGIRGEVFMDPRDYHLARLDFFAPPMLAKACGYEGIGRFVGLWWEPVGDGVIVSDGLVREAGNPRGWLAFTRHPLVCRKLWGFRLGTSKEKPIHRLLVDHRYQGLYVGHKEDVKRLLMDCNPQIRAAQENPLETMAVNWKSYRKRIQKASGGSGQGLYERMKRRGELVERLRQWMEENY